MVNQFELTEEQSQLRDLARKVAEEFRDRATVWETTGEFPWENMKRLAETGLLGVSIPEEHGGGGGTWLDAAVVLEELGRCCYTTAMAALGEVGVQTRVIAAYGSDDVQGRHLPAAASGDAICSICLTEPDTGSDLRAMRTTARDDGAHVVVSGRKTLISRADVASVFVVFTKIAGTDGSDQVGAVVIEKKTPGLTVGQAFQTLGGDTLHEVSFDGCRIPASNVLARDDGLRRLMSMFNGQRCLNASISVGIASGAQELAIGHAKHRHQGGQPIGDYQGIGWLLADSEIAIEAARLLVWRAAAKAGRGTPQRHEASIAKVSANEMALRVTDTALQVFGGHGWTKEMPIERYLRWARYGPLGGGTPQIQRNGIARHLLRGGHAAARA